MPPLLTIGLSLLLALFSAALTYSTPYSSSARMNFTAGTFFTQIDPAPQQEDRSEIGSTDEIVAMSGVISLIIIFPILLKRKSWR
ncbi:MAG TPA: hypothetical protein VJ785_14390 [Anaerolineales bacterium]|nr:hypothetical protein [Anaerolineales bacterium]